MGYASLAPRLLHIGYTTHPQHPEQAESTYTVSKHGIQVDQINLDLSQEIDSIQKHWSLPSVRVRIRVRVRVGWYVLTYNKLGVRIEYPQLGARKLVRI